LAEAAPDESRNVFHVTVHRLRCALESELCAARHSRYIRYSGERYRFNFDAPHWLDVTAFESVLYVGTVGGSAEVGQSQLAGAEVEGVVRAGVYGQVIDWSRLYLPLICKE
jgi:hypothetical protein